MEFLFSFIKKIYIYFSGDNWFVKHKKYLPDYGFFSDRMSVYFLSSLHVFINPCSGIFMAIKNYTVMPQFQI